MFLRVLGLLDLLLQQLGVLVLACLFVDPIALDRLVDDHLDVFEFRDLRVGESRVDLEAELAHLDAHHLGDFSVDLLQFPLELLLLLCLELQSVHAL